MFKRSDDANNCTENEVYLECGSKCVLGCKEALSPLGITLSTDKCESSECVQGCFCEEGLVRHRDKCIPVTECSDQRQGKSLEVPASSLKMFKSKDCGVGDCTPQNCGPDGCTDEGQIQIQKHNETMTGEKNDIIYRLQLSFLGVSMHFLYNLCLIFVS